MKAAIESYLDLNEWQIKEIIEAVKEADSPSAEWTNQADVKAKWEAKRDQMALGRPSWTLTRWRLMSPWTTPGLLLKFCGEKTKTAGRAPGAYMA